MKRADGRSSPPGGARGGPWKATAALLLVAALTHSSLAAPAGASSGSGRCSVPKHSWDYSGTSAGHGWIWIVPPFTGGSAGIRSVAVAPGEPRDLYVADRDVLNHSPDGGCSWRRVLDVRKFFGTEGGSHGIASVAVTERSRGRPVVHVVVESVPAADNVAQPKVLTLDPRSGSWRVSDDPDLPSVGSGAELQVAPTDPSTLYLAALPGALLSPSLFVSRDGGRSWDPMAVLTPSSGAALVEADWGFFADAGRDGSVGAWDGRDLWHTKDAGGSWAAPASLPPECSSVVAVAARGPSIVASCSGDRLYASRNGGTSWNVVTLPVHASASTLHFGSFSPNPVVGLSHLVYEPQQEGTWIGDRSLSFWRNVYSPFVPNRFLSASVPGAPLLAWARNGNFIAEYVRRW